MGTPGDGRKEGHSVESGLNEEGSARAVGAARRKLRCQRSARCSSLPAHRLSGPAAAALPGQAGRTWVSGVGQPRWPPRPTPNPPPPSPRPPGPALRQQVVAGAGRARAPSGSRFSVLPCAVSGGSGAGDEQRAEPAEGRVRQVSGLGAPPHR